MQEVMLELASKSQVYSTAAMQEHYAKHSGSATASCGGGPEQQENETCDEEKSMLDTSAGSDTVYHCTDSSKRVDGGGPSQFEKVERP